MKRKNAARNALFTSVISLLLCVSMLVGTTFAWFTDEVTSGINTITAGNLDVELYHSDKAEQGEKVDSTTVLFDDVTLWEPGAVVYENFVVENEGNLALKYQLSINFSEETIVNERGLSEALKVAVVKGGFNGGRADAEKLTNLAPLSSFVLSGELEGDTKSETYGIVIYWQPTDNDNDFNMKDVAKNDDGSAVNALTIKLGVNLFATQKEYEEDSFGKDYDESANMKTPANADGSATLTAASAPSATNNETTVEAPAGAFEPEDEVEIVVEADNSAINVSAKGAVVASLDVTMLVNGEEMTTELPDGKVFTVKTYITKGLDRNSIQVTYTGTDGKAQPTFVDYDPESGLLVFTTNHFSEYVVSAKAYGYNKETDTAYGTAKEAADAIENGADVSIAEGDKQAVMEALPAEKQEEFKEKYAVAKVGSSTEFLTFAEAANHAVGISGAEITLLANATVDADQTITIPSGIITKLNLNGYTLSAESNETGSNRNLFDVRGQMNVYGGTINFIHTGDNMGWNNPTNVFNVTAGGVLNIENATIENLGGSDMAFCVHLNNWGEVTLKAENTTFKSTYIPVRVFNSGNDMNNVTIKNSTLTGKYCYWVHNYTLDDFGTQEKVDAHKALLNEHILNNGNVFNNTGKAPLLYGFTNAIYMDANGSVVAGSEDDLKWALENGKKVLLSNDLNVSKINLTTVNYDVVIDGNGYTITTTESYGIQVTPGKNVTISNAKIKMTKNGDYLTYAAGLKIENGDYTGNTVKLENCTITMANTDWAYAVNMPASVVNLNLEINDCTLEGAIAVQVWGDNNTISVTDSKLICNYTTSELYTSYCVALQSDGTNVAENNTVNIHSSEFAYSGVDEYNSSIDAAADKGSNNTLAVTNCTYGDKIVYN